MSDFFEIIFEGNTITRLLNGLGVTLEIALLSALFSTVFGIIYGLIFTSKNRIVRSICKLYLEFFRLMPQLVLLFVFYYGIISSIGINLDAVTCAVIVFTLWGTAEMGDLVRSSVLNVPKGQIEAASSIGLNSIQCSTIIKLPLAIRQIIPGNVNLITRMIKTTAIVPLIGIIDVTKSASAIIDFNRFTHPGSAIYLYSLVFILYFLCCFPIARFATYLQKKLM